MIQYEFQDGIRLSIVVALPEVPTLHRFLNVVSILVTISSNLIFHLLQEFAS